MLSFQYKLAFAGVAVLLVLFGVWYYGHTQFLAGAAATKLELIEQINESEGLKHGEAQKAITAARDAARRVCEQYGLSPEACDEF